MRTARSIFEDRDHNLLIAGYGGMVKRDGDRFVPVMTVPASLGQFVTIARDRNGNYWIEDAYWRVASQTGRTRFSAKRMAGRMKWCGR